MDNFTIPATGYAGTMQNYGVAPVLYNNPAFSGLDVLPANPLVPSVGTSGPLPGGDIVQPPDPTPEMGFWGKMGLTDGKGSLNLGGIGELTKSLASLGSLYGAFQANKLAKESLEFQKKAYKTNLANQIKSYNTALSDRATSRYQQNTGSTAGAAAYIDENKL